MLINYLKTALRLLRRHATNTFINTVGLGVALASSLLIIGHVTFETSFDSFHPDAQSIYQVTYQEVSTPAMRHVPTVSPPVAPTMVEEFPEVQAGLRFRIGARHLVSSGEERYFEEGIVYVDSSFFDVLGFELVRGDPRAVLREPGEAVLTESISRKYFGDEDPIGRSITIDDERTFTVTGVVEDVPDNTHIRYEILLPFQDFRVPTGYPVTLADWQWISFPTFIKLVDGADAQALEQKLRHFMARHFPPSSAENARLRLKPIQDVYLSGPVDPAFVTGNRAYLNGLLGIAGLILVLSIFNFTNLTAVQALRRGREVGVRKVLGADRRHLRRQLIGESAISAIAGLLAAILLLGLASGLAPEWLGVKRALALLDRPEWIAGIVLAGPVLGVLGGLYPSLLLSRLDVVDAIKQKLTGRGRIATIRNGLVVIQFAIAVGLIIASIVVTQQLRFLATTDLGFDREHVVTVETEGEQLRRSWPALRGALSENPNVVSVTSSGHLMDGDQGSMPMIPDGVEPEDARAMNLYGVNFGFAETMGLRLVEGRTHDVNATTDSADGIVINRAAAEYLAATAPGWDEPLGRRLQVGEIMEGRVIGVVEDFHFASLHNEIEPLVMIIPRANMDNVLIRVQPGNLDRVLSSLTATWKSVLPDVPFDYGFLDEHLQDLYEKEQIFLRLVTTFSLLAILIACLGLYGLVSFICTVRTKEIAVRKVLGARVAEIVSQILRPFGVYILIANALAWPLAWFALDRWLTGFAYHVDVGPAVFVAAAAASLLVGFVTVVMKTVRAALANPTVSLGVE